MVVAGLEADTCYLQRVLCTAGTAWVQCKGTEAAVAHIKTQLYDKHCAILHSSQDTRSRTLLQFVSFV